MSKITKVLDVARRAGVSTATVSRVLSGRGPVSDKAREKVMAAAKELGFSPNALAQGLRRGQSNMVAFLVGDIEQSHFALMTKAVEETLREIGLDVILYNLNHSAERLGSILTRVRALGLRGVILATPDILPREEIGPLLDNLVHDGVSVVCWGQDISGWGIASIVHEERAAVRKSVRYLIQQGRTPVAYVGRIVGSVTGSERYEGYADAHREAGLEVDPKLVWDAAYRYAAGEVAVGAALDRGLAFSGLQCASDELALGAISALVDHGRKVPDDVAVIGFSEVVWAKYLRPTLTTLSVHHDTAASFIKDVLQKEPGRTSEPGLLTIPRSLVRGTSA